MRHLLATTALTPLLLVAIPALAQTNITTKRTTPVTTAEGGDVSISSAGSVELTTGTAVTLNSTNNVKNEGTIQITGANGATGILVTAGGSGTITNSGKIVIDENYTPADPDKDGDNDGPFAQGSNRFAIRTADGIAFTGSIANSGTITVEGNNSGGIRLGGALNGSLASSGTISVLGDNSVGVRAGAVSGNVTLTGTITTQGANSVGVALDGDVGGKLVFQGAVTSTGYRYVTPPSDTSKLDADDLLQGGPAVRIAGSAVGGVLFDARPADNNKDDTDEDDDGIPDAQEGTASITSLGAAPAVVIGSADRDLSFGAVAGDAGGHGLVIKGGITGNGLYGGVDATGLAIGGQGHGVDLAGGIALSGSVTAAGKASATAIRIGAGTQMGEIAVSGTVAAQGGSDAAHLTRGIAIATGASVPKLVISGGKIGATTAGNGTATAVLDQSGTLTLIENSGTVAAAGAGADTNRAVAFDLRANTSGVTLKQLAVGQNAAAPGIGGNVLFGSGNDVFDVADGSVNGNVDFGAGANTMRLSGDAVHSGKVVFGTGTDTLSLAGTSKLTGDVDFGGGAGTLTLASGTSLIGAISNSGAVAATIAGRLDATNSGAVSLASLDVAGTGVIGVAVDGAAGTATRYQVGGTANFAEGAKLLVHLNGIASSLGSYTVIQAGTLTGADKLTTTGTVLPWLFKSSLSSNAAAGTVTLKIDRKSATELGMNASATKAYDAVFAVLDKDAEIAGTFLAINDAETFNARFGAFMPEHAGGAFESITQASRAAARFLDDRQPRHADRGGKWNIWLGQFGWGTSKDLGDTAAYDVGGWGMAGGAEVALGDAGYLGGTLSFGLGRDADGSNDNEVMTGQYEAGIHWRGRFGGLGLGARAAAAMVDFDGTRRIDGQGYSRVAKGSWSGMLYSASASASYDVTLGRLFVRPLAAFDYYRLTEDGYAESGGGAAFDLTVDERTSDEATATGSLTIGYELGSLDRDETWMRVELEGGRREIVGGALGSTTARFATGSAFTLDPELRESGWLGRIRLSGGRELFAITGEAGAEEQQGHAAISARISARFGW